MPGGGRRGEIGDGLGTSPSRAEALPRPIPVPVRQKPWERSRQGEKSASLAAAFDLSPRTVRDLLKRLRERGEAGPAADYRPPPLSRA